MRRRNLWPFREKRVQNLNMFVGPHYSGGSAGTGGGGYSGDRQPLNVLQVAVNIFLRQLIPSVPRCMCTTKNRAMKAVAADMEAWMNHASEEMRLEETLRRFVMDALFCLGIVKIAESVVGNIDFQGTLMRIGQPFCEVVDLDDYVCDMLAKRPDQFEFEGNRYRVALSAVQDNKDFKKSVREKVQTMYSYAYNEYGDPRPTILTTNYYMPTMDEVEDHVELWDIFLPREQLIVTFQYIEHVGGYAEPLKIQEWTGPREGPYHRLGFTDVPDNTTPSGPVTVWRDLHELLNRILNKLADQSDRQKTVTTFTGPATKDAERVQRASDGEMVRVDRPGAVEEHRYGGVDKEQMLFLESMKQLYSWQAGNLESQGGLGVQSPTAHQDELLHESSSAQTKEMQARTTKAFGRIYDALGFHWWKNPTLTYHAHRQVAGIDIPVNLTPQMRQMSYDHLDLDLDPYSLQEDTPNTRGGRVMQIFTQLGPFIPSMLQAGYQIQWAELLGILARFFNVAELGDILKQGPPPAMQGPTLMAQQATQQAVQPPASPAVTSRTNIRKSVPTQLSDKAHGQIMSQLLAGGANGQQRAALGR